MLNTISLFGTLKVYLWFHIRVFFVSIPSSVYQINIGMTSCRLNWKTHFIRFCITVSIQYFIVSTGEGEDIFIIMSFFLFMYRLSEKIFKQNIYENKSL
jgi:hypothetical protein